MSVILSVSISIEQERFLNEMQLSPSELIQSAIEQERARSIISAELLKAKEKTISVLQEKLTQMGTFINKKGLTQEYCDLP
jgi:predicted alpha/beta superfamily hydrolase